ncbi:MAG: BMP family ABC transporter substrate-binding protein [Eubacteriales bacterium]|nr:BMP family ABC transporter substrate-binding protein [Eubacteriales bacterium]
MKKWSRFAAAAMAAVMTVTALTACGGKTEETTATAKEEAAEATTAAAKEEAEAESGEKKEIYVFIRDRGDLSYWDSMAEGGDRATKDYADRANVHVVETTVDLQANLQAMYEAADAGADLIITASDFKDNLVEVANEYPEIAFTIISEDVVSQCENGNTYGVDFATSQAAYLGGIVAADLAKNGTADMEPTGTIGFIGGMDESLVIQEFLWGYIQGAKAYDPNTKIVYNYVGAWNDPDTAKTQAMTQYNDAGADVIFACAGGSGNGVHNAAAEAGKFVIGVDSDQSLLYSDDKAIQEKFATSVIKQVGNAVYNVIGEFLDTGKLPYGEYEVLGLADEAVGIVEGDVINNLLSEEGKAALEAAKKGIIDGSVEVKSAIGKGQDEVKAFIDENCQ